MIEVFSTNVTDPNHAAMLLDRIHEEFAHYQANFDLSDCDNILRVVSVAGLVDASTLINLLHRHGFQAAVLPGD
jgi:hypothetical protein